MSTGTYKLQSVARPGRYIALFELSVVGHSADSGLVIEWVAQFDKDNDNLASLHAFRPGSILDLYISFDSETGTLKVSKEPFFFLIKPSPRQSSFISIEVPGIQKVFALTSWDEGTPIELQPNTDSTQQLWLFDKVESAE